MEHWRLTQQHSDEDGDQELGVVIKEETKVPPMYKVVLLNDDFTPMEFVVAVLKKYFNKSQEAATEIMLRVHHEGRAVCGIYSYEIAETKVALVTESARQHHHPLMCTLEKA
jgi:ATP-dependent Clp protease adaptor protein ClpS